MRESHFHKNTFSRRETQIGGGGDRPPRGGGGGGVGELDPPPRGGGPLQRGVTAPRGGGGKWLDKVDETFLRQSQNISKNISSTLSTHLSPHPPLWNPQQWGAAEGGPRCYGGGRKPPP